MKKFILLVAAFWLIFFSINAGLRWGWVKFMPQRLERNVIKDDVRLIVVGPSNGECAWNDAIIPHSKNLCLSAASMAANYNIIKWAVEYNSANIDTVCLCASILSILYSHDEKISPAFEEDKILLDYGDYFQRFKSDPTYIKLALSSFNRLFLHTRRMGGQYNALDRDKLNHPKAYDYLISVVEKGGGKYGWTEEKIRDLCSYQVKHLERIKQYCKDHGLTLVILNTPVYRTIGDYLDDSGYRNFLKSELGDSTLIADYSNFTLPDDNYYGDIEHLNHKGADFFSKYIAEHGLEVQPIASFCP